MTRLMVRHKFNAKPTTLDGMRFDSKAEARYYQRLKTRQLAGEVLFFLRQVPFHLPGGVKYVCDFLVFLTDGTAEFVDVKGVRTQTYAIKKKQVEALYPIEIKEAKLKRSRSLMSGRGVPAMTRPNGCRKAKPIGQVRLWIFSIVSRCLRLIACGRCCAGRFSMMRPYGYVRARLCGRLLSVMGVGFGIY